MTIPADLALLLDHARAEAKRHDHAEVTLLHVAAAIRRRNPEQFSTSYGDSGSKRLDELLDDAPQAQGRDH